MNGVERRRRARRVRLAVGALVLVAVVAGGIAWRQAGKAKAAAPTYLTGEATKETLVVTVDGSGSMLVVDSEDVVPAVSGTVRDLEVEVGDVVKEGQTLFEVENDDLDDAVTSALGQLRQAEQSLDRAKLERLQSEEALDALDSRPTTPTDTEVEAAELKVKIAKTGVLSAQANLTSAQRAHANAKETASDRAVESPMSGVVTEVNVKEGGSTSGSAASGSGSSSGMSGGSSAGGSSSGGGSSAAIVISDLKNLKARVQVNEVDLARVKKGQKATLTFDAIEGLEVTGKVVRVAPTGTSSNGVVVYDVDIVPDVTDSRVKPGMSVSAAITVELRKNVLTVPNAAVKSSGGASYVEVLGSDGKTTDRVQVEAGASNESRTEVTGELKPGDRVVTSSSTGSTQGGNQQRGGFMGSPGGGMRMMGGPR